MVNKEELRQLCTKVGTLTNEFLDIIRENQDEKSREEIKLYVEEFERFSMQLRDSFKESNKIQKVPYYK